VKGTLFWVVVVAQRLAGDDHHDFGDGWWIVMMIGMVLFWVLVAVGIVWLVRNLQGGTGSLGRGEPTPLAVLDRRLAEGAISVEEYEQRRQVLLGSSGERSEG
jgi:putative membrane protein